MTTPNLGDLQHLTMVAVVRLGDNAYGGSIQEELREIAQRDLSVSSVYVTLVRLEEQGLLRSEKASRGEAAVGRPRRVFQLTDKGWEALRAARRSLDRIWDGVELA